MLLKSNNTQFLHFLSHVFTFPVYIESMRQYNAYSRGDKYVQKSSTTENKKSSQF